MLLRIVNNKDMKLLPIQPKDVSYAAELRSLSLSFFEIQAGHGRRTGNALWSQVSCENTVKEPSNCLPSCLNRGVYMFKCGDIVYEYTCQEVTCEAAREQRLF